MSNLEPIDESDLDLKSKFNEEPIAPGKEEKNEITVNPEAEVQFEATSERKEGVVEKDEAYSKILSKVKAAAPAKDDEVAMDAQLASEEADAEAKVEKLVQVAMQKGVPHAVKVAQHLEDNYLLDEFHDRLLADDLHASLLQKGLIKES